MSAQCRSMMRVVAMIFAMVLTFSTTDQSASAQAAEGEPVKITIRTTDGGFDPAIVKVEQGKVVELTFVWDHTAYLQEEHIMVISGYKLETETINSDHRQTTVKFIAVQSGTFDFKCDLECELHDAFQNGQIIVKPSSGGAVAQLTPSKLVVDPANGVLIRGGTVSIGATLMGEDGEPIPRAEVHFYARQEFLGKSGLMEIGVAKTLPNGFATLLYRPTTDSARTLVAKFSGVGLYDATEAQIALVGSDQFVPRAGEAHDDSLHGLKGAAQAALVVVIAGLWIAFGFMAFLALGIKRAADGGKSG